VLFDWSIVAGVPPYKVPIDWSKVVIESLRLMVGMIPWWLWLVIILILLSRLIPTRKFPRSKRGQR
jgi:hypothetical protein